MNKRGQFYIITVVVLSLALITVVTKVNTIKEPILFEDFSSLTKNYLKESKSVINHAILNKRDISQDLNLYTQQFLTEARKKNPNTGLVFIFSDGQTTEITNYLDSGIDYQNSSSLGANQGLINNVEVEIGGTKFLHQVPVKAKEFGSTWYTTQTPSGKPIDLSVSGFLHNFKTTPNEPEFKVILRYFNYFDPGIEYIIGGNSSVEGDISFSPDSRENPYILVQQEVNQ